METPLECSSPSFGRALPATPYVPLLLLLHLIEQLMAHLLTLLAVVLVYESL